VTDEVTREWRQQHNEKLHSLFCLLHAVKI